MSLRGIDLNVSFGGLLALDGASVEVQRSSIHALIGPNGAGKTTFINCLSGFVKWQAGCVEVDGHDLASDPAYQRAKFGIARSFQTPRADPEATVFESVLIGSYSQATSRLVRSILGTPRHGREHRAAHDRTEELLDRFGLTSVRNVPTGDLPIWHLRLLEVARAVSVDPGYILLDEPAAGLDDDELNLLRSVIAELRERGVGVLLVEHNFGFVRSLADEVTVLAEGRPLAHGTPSEIESDPVVVDTYLGSTDVALL